MEVLMTMQSVKFIHLMHHQFYIIIWAHIVNEINIYLYFLLVHEIYLHYLYCTFYRDILYYTLCIFCFKHCSLQH